VWSEVCEDDADGLQMFAAVAQDDGTSREQLRTDVRHACPDRLEDLEDGFAGTDQVSGACDMPPAERTEDEQLLAEAMGC
jgi:hypothetical protein